MEWSLDTTALEWAPGAGILALLLASFVALSGLFSLVGLQFLIKRIA